MNNWWEGGRGGGGRRLWEQDKWSWVKEDGGSVLTLMVVHVSQSAAVIYIQLSRGSYRFKTKAPC